MVTLMAFVVFGGASAYASHELILSSDIVDGEVKTPDLATDAVTQEKLRDASVGRPQLANGVVSREKINNSAVDGSKVADNSLMGDDVNESSLGKVPDADTLDDLDSTQLSPVTGDGRTADLALTDSIQTVLSANITTARSASLLASAAVHVDESVPGAVFCSLRFDGTESSVQYITSVDGAATLPVVWAHGVGPGAHTVELQCHSTATVVVRNAGMHVSAHL
jgi:hypothetical protein